MSYGQYRRKKGGEISSPPFFRFFQILPSRVEYYIIRSRQGKQMEVVVFMNEKKRRRIG